MALAPRQNTTAERSIVEGMDIKPAGPFFSDPAMAARYARYIENLRKDEVAMELMTDRITKVLRTLPIVPTQREHRS